MPAIPNWNRLVNRRTYGNHQYPISEMEHGKRAIGKARAKQLTAVLRVDYHVFL